MTFWIFTGVVTALALVVLLRPLISPAVCDDGDDDPRKLFDDQLAELDRDLSQNRLNSEQYAAARVELQRRFLRTQRQNRTDEQTGGGLSRRSLRIIAGGVIVGFPTVVMGLYLAFGSPGTPGLPHRERLALEQAAQEEQAAQLVKMEQSLQRRLNDNPTNIRNWLLLARLRIETNDLRGSVAAFKGALDNGADDAQTHGSYGEMLVATDDGRVNKMALGAFRTALERDPDNPRALFYSALALQQSGRQRDALAIWLKLRTLLTTNSPWLAVTDERIEKTAEGLNLDAVDLIAANPARSVDMAPAVGPSQADMQAAQELSADEQKDMIRGMVNRLAERLANNPDDPEGWLRLTRSYLILGERSKAQDSFARARRAAEGSGQIGLLQNMESIARQWGLEEK